MRVINDKQEKTEPSELGFFTIAAYAILSAFGIATVILGPLPMILSHARLTDPWPKVTALLGAVIALTFLEVPLPLVVLTFILGLFMADRVWHESSFGSILRDTLLLATLVGLGGLFLMARLDKVSVPAFWQGQVDAVITQLKASIRTDGDYRWDVVRGMLLYEGPFFYLSGVLLSLWISVGFSAHLGWLVSPHRYSSESLRGIRLPAWASLVFGILFVGSFIGHGDVTRLVGGLFRIACCIMFMQGTICLSDIMARKGIRPRARTVVYGLAIVLAFYVMVGVGVLSPWFFKRTFFRQRLEEVT